MTKPEAILAVREMRAFAKRLRDIDTAVAEFDPKTTKLQIRSGGRAASVRASLETTASCFQVAYGITDAERDG